MTLLEFYTSLPTLEQMPGFYVPGYTEALKTFTGVRVIPNPSFVDGLSKEDEKYLLSRQLGWPRYFIPLILGNNCYGYVLKSYVKRTPRRHTKNVYPGQELIKQGDVVCLVEGIKDAYILRALKLQAIPMLTSEPCDELIDYLEMLQCKLVFVPDNDDYRGTFIKSFREKISSKKIPYYIYKLEGVKDLGDYFLPELREAAMLQAKKILRVVRALKNV